MFLTEVGSRISISCELMEGVNDPCFERTPHTETTPPGLLMGKKLPILNVRDAKFFSIYTARADGTAAIRVVEMEKAHGESPVWSPDGTEIAYVVQGEIHWASRQIRFINLKTRKQETLLPDNTPRMRRPAWSSSVHNKIAFVWYRPEHDHTTVFTANRGGSGLQQIVDVQALARLVAIW